MMNNSRVVWVFNSMGYNNNLLYWDTLLKSYFEEFPDTKILTCETESRIKGTNHKVSKSVSRYKLKFGRRVFMFPSPMLILQLARLKPGLIVVSEFSLLSLYAVLYKFFSRKTKVLLLVENDPVVTEAFNALKRTGIFYNFYRRIVARCSDKVLCNNDKAALYLSSVLKMPAEKIITGCYLSSAIYSSNQQIRSKNFLDLLFVGRLTTLKGVKHLIKALSLLPEASLQSVRLRIVGEGPDREFLKQLIAESNLQKVIYLCGAQPYESLGEYFFTSNVFVFPTLNDYRALVGFEALSAGMPIIGSVFDGAGDEVIDEGENGFIVDPRDEKSLAAKMQFFLDDLSKIEEFGFKSMQKYELVSPAVARGNLISASLSCFEGIT